MSCVRSLNHGCHQGSGRGQREVNNGVLIYHSIELDSGNMSCLLTAICHGLVISLVDNIKCALF